MTLSLIPLCVFCRGSLYFFTPLLWRYLPPPFSLFPYVSSNSKHDIIFLKTPPSQILVICSPFFCLLHFHSTFLVFFLPSVPYFLISCSPIVFILLLPLIFLSLVSYFVHHVSSPLFFHNLFSWYFLLLPPFLTYFLAIYSPHYLCQF